MAFFFWFCSIFWPAVAFIPITVKRNWANKLSINKSIDEWFETEVTKFVAVGLIVHIALAILFLNVVYFLPAQGYTVYMTAISAIFLVSTYIVIGISATTYCAALVAKDQLLESDEQIVQLTRKHNKDLAAVYEYHRKRTKRLEEALNSLSESHQQELNKVHKGYQSQITQLEIIGQVTAEMDDESSEAK